MSANTCAVFYAKLKQKPPISGLKTLLLAGLETGRDIPISQSFWRELKVAARKRLVKKKSAHKTRVAR